MPRCFAAPHQAIISLNQVSTFLPHLDHLAQRSLSANTTNICKPCTLVTYHQSSRTTEGHAAPKGKNACWFCLVMLGYCGSQARAGVAPRLKIAETVAKLPPGNCKPSASADLAIRHC